MPHTGSLQELHRYQTPLHFHHQGSHTHTHTHTHRETETENDMLYCKVNCHQNMIVETGLKI